MKEYHLHKNDYSKLQLDVYAAQPYCQKYSQHCYKPHRHSYFQVIWFKSPGIHYVDYQEYKHEQNTIFFLTQGQVHNFCKSSKNEGFLFHFNDIFLDKNDSGAAMRRAYRLFNELEKPFVKIPSEAESDFQHLTDKLLLEIEHKPYNYQEQLYFYFQIFLLNIERLKQKENTTPLKDHHFELAMRFKKSLEENRNHFRNVNYFSTELGITDKTLSTISKKYFGETPANLIHKKRTLEAKRLLANSKLSIKEIAYELGFEQATYFTKYFKKHTAQTPKDFQQQFR